MSRTLGFIAGLTVPAGLYYYSVLNLNHTTNYISQNLREQQLRLENPSKIEPIVLEPRHNGQHLVSRIHQGWNQGIENGVRFLQDVDWTKTAETTAEAVSNISKSVYKQLQPSIEDGKEKLSELSEQTRDGALHAGEAVGSALHKVGVKAQDLAEQSKIQAHDLAEQGRVKSHELAKEGRVKAAQAKDYLDDAEERAARELSSLKSQASHQAAQLKDEAARQAKEAGSLLSSAGSRMQSKLHDMTHSATTALRDAPAAAERKLNDAEQKVHDALLSTRLRASEDWILANERMRALTEAIDTAASMKLKEAEQAVLGRRIGFASVNDPTGAQRQVEAAERYNAELRKRAAMDLESESATRIQIATQ